MKNILLILLLPVFLWGSKILTYNVYDKQNYIDVMITFDTPYEGILRQNRVGDSIVIKLEQATIDTKQTKVVNSKYLKYLSITPANEHIEIEASISADVILQASKTPDSYALRLRFSEEGATNTEETSASQSDEATMAIPSENKVDVNAILMISGGLVFLIISSLLTLRFLKRKREKFESATSFEFEHFLEEETIPTETAPVISEEENNSEEISPDENKITSLGTTDLSEIISLSPNQLQNIKIRFQKNIDDKNSVAMLDFGPHSYLVLLGNTTVLLDKFHHDVPMNETDFDSLLRAKQKDLDVFFKLSSHQDNIFDTYKEKASGNY